MNEKCREICEDLDWTVTYCSDGTIELKKYSPAGEDFLFYVDAKNFVNGVKEYSSAFNIDEHIAMWIEARRNGVSGVPPTRELVRDAEAISGMLEELAMALARQCEN